MQTKRNTRLSIERLERRELMAADGLPSLEFAETPTFYGPLLQPPNAAEAIEEDPQYGSITAAVIDGVLTIRGDAARNFLQLYGPNPTANFLQPGSIEQYRQRYSLTAYGTRIVGHEAFSGNTSVFFENVTAFDVDLGDGDDYLRILNSLTGPLTLRTGAGNDEILLRGRPASSGMAGFNYFSSPAASLPMQGDLFIDTGAGNDQLTVDAEIDGDATVLMGAGDDFFTKLSDGNRFSSQDQHAGIFSASGNLIVDLGADQDVEVIPNDWRDDPIFADRMTRMPDVLAALELYSGVVERGEATLGTPQLIELPEYQVAARVDAAGRLEVNFSFTAGYARVIDRLRARGVVLEAYAIEFGNGRALIREEDLKLFANLPGFYTLSVRSVPLVDPVLVIPGYEWNTWEFVLPGTSTAEEIADVARLPDFGPPRLEDVRKNANPTLLESYYSNRPFGPLQAQ